MTVKELIEELEKYPPEAQPVVWYDLDTGKATEIEMVADCRFTGRVELS